MFQRTVVPSSLESGCLRKSAVWKDEVYYTGMGIKVDKETYVIIPYLST